MPALSPKDAIDWLERELPPNPPKFKLHDGLPFAIVRYDPEKEWELRHQMRLFAARLEKRGRKVVVISLADLLWEAIRESEGIDALLALEAERGFEVAQEQVHTYLSDDDFAPLPRSLARRLESLDPDQHICFLDRAAALGPALYRISTFLDEMQGKTKVPTILFYPGKLRGRTSLDFMGLGDREPLASYRVKIYG